MRKIVIGTRGSQLSLIQTTIVKNLLHSLLQKTTIEIVTITTSGDKNLSPIPLDTIGKGWFTKEIDRQLLEGKIDIAVHSLKDLLDTMTPGLQITAIPERENALEALVSKSGFSLKKLKKGAVVGTDSVRRKMQILRIRPDLTVQSVRGNVNKRLEKMDSGQYDALVLAIAGLKRLHLEERIVQYFTIDEIIPSPGQGALAVVTRKNNSALNTIVAKLNHTPSVTAVTAEREFSKALGGGCSMPVGAYAQIKGKKILLYGMLGSKDEKYITKANLVGPIHDPKGLARKLADKLLKKSLAWKTNNEIPHIIVTREQTENKKFAMQLHDLGLKTLLLPTISIRENLSPKEFRKYISHFASYDWIFFTSSNGVKFFIEGLQAIGEKKSLLKRFSIGTVGTITAETARKYGLSVTVVPKTFTSKNLLQEVKNLKGKRILFPRSAIGDKDVLKQFQKIGARVTDMPVYRTENIPVKIQELTQLLEKNRSVLLTFTSPSTIQGFLKNVDKILQQKVLSLPVISIGPTTTRAAQKYGFTDIQTADTYTMDGILIKIRERVFN